MRINSIRTLLTLVLFIGAPPIFSHFDLSVDGGYGQVNFTQKINTGSTVSASAFDMSGYFMSSATHYNFDLSGSRLGIGPKFGFGNQSVLNLPAGYSKAELSFIRIGGELVLYFTNLKVFEPFFRVALGKDFVSQNSEYATATSGVSAQEVDKFGGLFYETMLGINFLIHPEFSVYLQAGFLGATYSNYTQASLSVGGSSVSTSALNGYSATYSGFLLGGGIVYSFK